MIGFIIVALFVASANAGTCPKYPILRDFDFKSYTGMWYQQDKLQSGWEVPGRCWKSLYIRDPKTGQYKMKMIFQNTFTGRTESYDSALTLLGPVKPSIIKYTLPLTYIEDKFQVLATDYESFSIEYKCHPNGLLEKRESIYLLTRAKNPSPLVLQKAYAIMHRYGIDLRKLERVDQSCGGIQIEDEYDDVTNYDYNYYDAIPDQQLDEQAPQQPVESVNQLRYVEKPKRRTGSSPNNRRRGSEPRPPLNLAQTLATRLWHVLHTPI